MRAVVHLEEVSPRFLTNWRVVEEVVWGGWVSHDIPRHNHDKSFNELGRTAKESRAASVF